MSVSASDPVLPDASPPEAPGKGAAPPGAVSGETALIRLLGICAAIMSVGFTLLLPAMHGWSAVREDRAAMQAEARLVAQAVSQIASRSPDLWAFQEVRLRTLLTPTLDGVTDAMRVRDAQGRVLAEAGVRLPKPWHRATAPIFEGGVQVGVVEVDRSLAPLMVSLAWVFGASLLLGVASYAALRLLPMRMLRRAMGRITHLATHDQLTGLPNRHLFNDRLQQIDVASRRYGTGFAVLCLDLDRFKEVNDTLGHAAGDELLRQVARRLGGDLRKSDTLARLGGDEFAIIQRNAAQPRAAEMLATRMVELLAQPFDLNGHQAMIGVSIGIAISGDSSSEQLLQDADTALYRVKAEGRNGFRFFAAEMNAALRERRDLERDLREALAKGQLSLFYQPQVNLVTQRVTGLEALLRWDHPERGRVTPDKFIPLAEEIGLLSRIGEWVLKEACATATRWPGIRMAVNISAHQFQGTDFLRAVHAALEESGLDPKRLEIEITEGVLLNDTDRTLATLGALHEMGISVAMDDFGTGYSSLGYLHKFRFDKIKIDRSFVAGLGDDPQAVAVIRAVIGITQALGLRCNAEGVESALQAAVLEAEGCTEGQGFLFGRAVPEHELAALIASAQTQMPRQATPPPREAAA